MQPVWLSSWILVNCPSNRRRGPVATSLESTDLEYTRNSYKSIRKMRKLRIWIGKKKNVASTFYLHSPPSPFLCLFYFYFIIVCMYSYDGPQIPFQQWDFPYGADHGPLLGPAGTGLPGPLSFYEMGRHQPWRSCTFSYDVLRPRTHLFQFIWKKKHIYQLQRF